MDPQKPKRSFFARRRTDLVGDGIPADHLLAAHYRHHWRRLRAWVGTHKKLAILYAALIVIGIIVAVIALSPHAAMQSVPIKKPTAATKVMLPPPPAPKYYSPLTGLEVPDQATTKHQVTAIMIENSQWARPQSGLLTAGVVYEAIAEGGITRFLTLFQESRPGLIGPVRSLRPYYIDWLAPFDAAVAHVGGSFNALNDIRSGKYKDIDEFFNGSTYWRATDRDPPHNVYTNFDKLDALNASKGYMSSTFTGFPRKTEAPSGSPSATSIDINISYDLFNVHYDYDRSSNTYVRSEGGAPHNDREGGRLHPKVVIVIKVPMHLGFEDGYREQMDTNGSGAAYVFQDGVVTQGTWSKVDRPSQIAFKDASGNPIALNPGQTWITAIPTDKSVTWK